MAVEHERAFEDEICAHLAAHGWLYSEDDTGYDKQRALFPDDVVAWLQETQPDEWAKVVKPTMGEAERTKAQEQLLDRLVRTLDLPLHGGGGTLNVLRTGFKKTPARFSMCEFRPNTTHNPAVVARYAAVRLRVMRQVHYSTKHNNSIDLVLFVNGLPVATLELKTDNTQSIDDAVAQYRTQRDPRAEPLLGFANRCLVHFAVSNDEAAMTTRLANRDTRFLPFNMGRDGGAGNPVTPGAAATAYLWKRVLEREAWLHILGKLLHLETRTDVDPITGEATRRTTLLFPRYHQWELVTRLLDTVRAEGPGHRYLVQHSAGSGKTNSISWTAHGLATLHDSANKKVFDTVIVVTDRTVLDDQLQQAVKQIEGVEGTVATINPEQVRNADAGSKSRLLAQELRAGRHIVIVTMQTFPALMDVLRDEGQLAGGRYAVIADEAHSSQTGRTSQNLRSVLTAQEQADLADGGEIDTEALLAAEMQARAESPNLSFFAFTATPKNKTLELFGRRPSPEEAPQAFHVYTMQQAIEEGYILDVLRNYTTYDTAFRIAEKSKAHLQQVKLVDESEATKGLMRWVSLHPTNIAQKVQIIVEHYRANVRHLLDGHGKAMVVTASREHAVRYKEAIDAYITKRGYNLAALVAFSGSLQEEQVPGVSFAHAQPPYTEHNLNTRVRGRALPVAFGSDDFQVLIVANKYQAGFDQPLLCAMYVDKRLSGVTAVQTLSRLNRTYAAGGKDTTYVFDFVNDPEEILESFRPYYREARIEGVTDPDIVHDLQAKLDAAGIYTDAEIEAFTTAYLAKRHGAISAPLKAAAGRFNTRYVNAIAHRDKATVEELDLFRKDVGSFIRLYDFLSQIVNYADTDLEKRSLFLRLLTRRLTGRAGTEAVDLSAVELTHIKQSRTAEQNLDLAGGDAPPLKPIGGSGTGTARDPRLVLLAEVLAKINDMFAGEDFTAAEQQSWVEGLVTVLMDDTTIQSQARTNTRRRFVESPDLDTKVTEAVLGNQASHTKMADYFFSDDRTRVEIVRLLGELVHESLHADAR